MFVFLFLSACFFPAGWRLSFQGITEPAGLVSDLSVGLLFACISWRSFRLLRALMLVLWFLFQVMSQELLVAVQRMPSWQDLAFVADSGFLKNSLAGFHFAQPGFAIGLAILSFLGILVPLKGMGRKAFIAFLGVGLLLLPLHDVLTRTGESRSVAARYNPLHWFVGDALRTAWSSGETIVPGELPPSLRTADLNGVSLFEQGRAKNILFVVLEGISGIYLPEIRQEMQVPEGIFQMEKLSAGISGAMLVPDFVAHSHQTIRGLYAICCGDFSKFSYALTKAVELEFNPERARQCLPAILGANGWETHYLQGAPLQFMNKDKAMPTMGFQQVHGVEWFTQRTNSDFVWGTTDEDFFVGADKYIRTLQAGGKPWFLTLLTVATHQPFDATDKMIARYGSRKIAAVAQLDEAVSQFIKQLRQNGILDDTLVIITSDESHGAEGADWYSSWGFAAVFAPEQQALPHLKKGSYGLVDLEVSVLDYLGLPLPPDVIGRSLFREYQNSREMVSYTSGKLRWQTKENNLYECTRDYDCLLSRNSGILGPHAAREVAEEGTGQRLFALATALDNTLNTATPKLVLQFANGEIRPLPEMIRNEWIDNLTGAQYLSFPKNSHVYVDILLQVTAAEPEGIQPTLILRQFEKEVGSISHPGFPLLKKGESFRLQFDFENPVARNAFSFHLIAAGRNAAIRFDKFEVVIDRSK
ncbi:MAG: sulfatase-like hydrolase/transferase [Desulfobacula sp.]|nr:sulfatase-like hydrolase/transferase [Desulfobacula sp.]